MSATTFTSQFSTSTYVAQVDGQPSTSTVETSSDAKGKPIGATRTEDRTSRITLESQFHIEPHILRGAQLHTLLRRCGSLWRRSPLELDEDSLAKLHVLSQQRTHLDYFISHAWATAGWAKHLSLTFFTIWQYILLSVAVTFLTTFCVLLTCGAPWDPLPDLFDAEVQGWQGHVIAHPGVGVFWGFAVYISVILFSSTVAQFSAFGKGDCCAFLDVVCINQLDKQLQLKGIKSLAGFISKSKEFLLLWSAPYFSRKWCVYEVAAFMKCHSQEQIIFQPVFMGSSAVVGACISLVSSVIWVAFASYVDVERESPAFIALLIVGFGLGLYFLRLCLRLQQIMHDQLEKFDVRQALCREKTDSDYIDRAIEHWYGGIAAFNDYVRTHLREHLLAKASVVHFSYWYCLFVNPFEPLIRVSYTAAYARAGVPVDAFVSLVIEIAGAIFCNGPVCVIGVYMLATKLSTETMSRRSAAALSFLSACVIVALWTVATEIAVRARNFHVGASMMMAVVQVSITWFVFRCLLPRYQSAHAELGKVQDSSPQTLQLDLAEPAFEAGYSPTVMPDAVGFSSTELWLVPIYEI